MFLKKVKGYKGRVYLQIVRGFRNEAGKTSHEVVKSLGYVDDLEQEFPDPIAHFTKVAKAMTNNEERDKAIKLDTYKTLTAGASSLRNAGYLALKPLVEALRLEQIGDALGQKHQTRAKIAEILGFLVYSQILNPGSKQSAYLKKNQFFENYQFSEEQMYRVLSTLGASHETIKDHIYRQLADKFNLDTSVTFYDGTNFYFEIDAETNFQKKGPSKEKRVEPLVSVGLLLDKNHIPLDYKVYPGNEHERPHFGKLINELKAKNKISGRTIYVADKGLNCGNNIFEAVKNGNGYIYSQTVKGASDVIKKYIINEYGFENVFNEYGELIYRIKGFVDDRARISFDYNGERKSVETKQLQVVTWSRKYAEKAAYERAKLIRKAKGAIHSPKAYNREILGKAANFVKNIMFDTKGEIIEGKVQIVLDEKKIMEDAIYDGYYLIVTSELDMEPREVLKNYRRLSQNEESFRVSKHFLKLRPVYLHREERIKAHVLVSYLALLIIRLFEQKVVASKYSFQEIIESIREYECAMIQPNTYFFFKYIPMLVSLAEQTSGNALLEVQTLSQIKNLFKYSV